MRTVKIRIRLRRFGRLLRILPWHFRNDADGRLCTFIVSKLKAKTLREIIDVNLKEENKAIAFYRSALRSVGQEGEILYETIEDILQDEQEHREELERLRE